MSKPTIIDDIEAWCLENNIPDDHGLKHFRAVASNAKIACKEMNLSEEKTVLVTTAAWVHDLDDRKLKDAGSPRYCGCWDEGYDFEVNGRPPPNHVCILTPGWDKRVPLGRQYTRATMILARHLPETDINAVLEMVDLVSCSKNADTGVEKLPADEMWKLIPMYADRLEALGEIGIRRCLEFTVRAKMPIATPQTPLPESRAELVELLKSYSLAKYAATGGKSASMLDHYLEKLLHLGRIQGVGETFQRWGLERREPLIAHFLQWMWALRRMKITEPIYPRELN